jgi:hypothetical protein
MPAARTKKKLLVLKLNRREINAVDSNKPSLCTRNTAQDLPNARNAGDIHLRDYNGFGTNFIQWFVYTRPPHVPFVALFN